MKLFFEKYFGIGASASFTEPVHEPMVYDFNTQSNLPMVSENASYEENINKK